LTAEGGVKNLQDVINWKHSYFARNFEEMCELCIIQASVTICLTCYPLSEGLCNYSRGQRDNQ